MCHKMFYKFLFVVEACVGGQMWKFENNMQFELQGLDREKLPIGFSSVCFV